MHPFEKNRRDYKHKGTRDHHEQYPTEEESLFDLYVSERTVDPILVEVQMPEQREEQQLNGSSKSSSSVRGNIMSNKNL